jgi:NitT/TauT family transport system ATP-binding protein
MEQPIISVEGVTQVYDADDGPVTALDRVDLDIKPGEFVSILGKSGCGKSTLLKIIGGLLLPSTGRVLVEGVPVAGPTRRFGYVFQTPVLLRWRSVLENVLLPIEVFGLKPADYRDRAMELLDMVHLSDFAHKRPHQLSGGMQQRVGLARCLIHNPDVLLMDEPFGALDAVTREQMNLELLRIWEQYKKTVIFVTHDISEAVFLSDRVLQMGERPGRIKLAVDIELTRPRVLDQTFGQDFSDYRKLLHEGMG